jgi:hypothetical protein
MARIIIGNIKLIKIIIFINFHFINSQQPASDALIIRNITREQEKKVHEYLEKNRHLYLILLSTIQEWSLNYYMYKDPLSVLGLSRIYFDFNFLYFSPRHILRLILHLIKAQLLELHKNINIDKDHIINELPLIIKSMAYHLLWYELNNLKLWEKLIIYIIILYYKYIYYYNLIIGKFLYFFKEITLTTHTPHHTPIVF